MNYGNLLVLILVGCENTDCNHCELALICENYGITPINIKQYLLECNKKLLDNEKSC